MATTYPEAKALRLNENTLKVMLSVVGPYLEVCDARPEVDVANLACPG